MSSRLYIYRKVLPPILCYLWSGHLPRMSEKILIIIIIAKCHLAHPLQPTYRATLQIFVARSLFRRSGSVTRNARKKLKKHNFFLVLVLVGMD